MLNDLTTDSLGSMCSNYEELRNYLHTRGREAYMHKKVSIS